MQIAPKRLQKCALTVLQRKLHAQQRMQTVLQRTQPVTQRMLQRHVQIAKTASNVQNALPDIDPPLIKHSDRQK